MQPNAICPRCGQPVVENRCPGCGSIYPPGYFGETKKSSALRYLIIGLVAYLAVGAWLLVMAGHRMMERAKHAAANPVQPLYPRHDGPVAGPNELNGSGTIYLIQMGDHKAPYSLDDFALWLRTKYKVDVRVLPAAAVDKSAWDAARGQYVAEALYEQMKRDHAELAADPNAYLIGFTDADMYSDHLLWKSSFTQRDMERAAIISAEGMQDSERWRYDPDASRDQKTDAKRAEQHFQARLRRILLKDVAILYWHLPVNEDRSSLLHDTLDPDLPSEDIYESDLDPARSAAGQVLDEPCIYFEYSAKQGMRPKAGPLIRRCADVEDPDEYEGVERFELDLRLGLLMDKRTDFFLPDTIPIAFQRVTRDGWKGNNPFGISGTVNYDEYLSSADNITISLVQADSSRIDLVREPRWLSNLSLVKYVDTGNSGFYEMRWRPTPFEHYDLKRFDGTVKTYLPCMSPTVFCYLTGYRNAQGQELKFERGDGRRLMRLTSPNQSWIRIQYEGDGRIAEATDSRGRTVHYGYDGQNRLTSVSYSTGEVCRYEYDGTQHLLAFSEAPNAKTAPRVLMRNEYANGLLVRQTMADGGVYSYTYDSTEATTIRSATVKSADGRIFHLDIAYASSTVHEEGPPRPTLSQR
jgi:YD repeat-containing protein